jgi:hypothetical protein
MQRFYQNADDMPACRQAGNKQKNTDKRSVKISFIRVFRVQFIIRLWFHIVIP